MAPAPLGDQVVDAHRPPEHARGKLTGLVLVQALVRGMVALGVVGAEQLREFAKALELG